MSYSTEDNYGLDPSVEIPETLSPDLIKGNALILLQKLTPSQQQEALVWCEGAFLNMYKKEKSIHNPGGFFHCSVQNYLNKSGTRINNNKITKNTNTTANESAKLKLPQRPGRSFDQDSNNKRSTTRKTSRTDSFDDGPSSPNSRKSATTPNRNNKILTKPRNTPEKYLRTPTLHNEETISLEFIPASNTFEPDTFVLSTEESNTEEELTDMESCKKKLQQLEARLSEQDQEMAMLLYEKEIAENSKKELEDMVHEFSKTISKLTDDLVAERASKNTLKNLYDQEHQKRHALQIRVDQLEYDMHQQQQQQLHHQHQHDDKNRSPLYPSFSPRDVKNGPTDGNPENGSSGLWDDSHNIMNFNQTWTQHDPSSENTDILHHSILPKFSDYGG